MNDIDAHELEYAPLTRREPKDMSGIALTVCLHVA